MVYKSYCNKSAGLTLSRHSRLTVMAFCYIKWIKQFMIFLATIVTENAIMYGSSIGNFVSILSCY